jgi:hypothetical protein
MKHSHHARVTRLGHPKKKNFVLFFGFALCIRLGHPKKEFEFLNSYLSSREFYIKTPRTAIKINITAEFEIKNRLKG